MRINISFLLHSEEAYSDKPIYHTDCAVVQLEAFKECWKRRGNDERTDAKDA